MSDLISVTPAAIVHIQQWVEKEKGIGLRVGVKKTGCSGFEYVTKIVAQSKSGDEVVHIKSLLPHQADLTIFIDQESKPIIAGMCIDYAKPISRPGMKSLQTARLIFINPREKGVCGCGESFTV